MSMTKIQTARKRLFTVSRRTEMLIIKKKIPICNIFIRMSVFPQKQNSKFTFKIRSLVLLNTPKTFPVKVSKFKYIFEKNLRKSFRSIFLSAFDKHIIVLVYTV